ncbi:MAG: N-acetylmuramoyl-L-alanine amidase [Ignavibacteriales bacterium]|nr:N-acetylmuramoyl-L-alanine amidase [Ignavibacteriales bacterium]
MTIETRTQRTCRRFGMPAATLALALITAGCSTGGQPAARHTSKKAVVVFQPSHQSDTGVNFNEAAVCNSIAEAALAASTGAVEVHKVWSYNSEGLHHAREGSNTKVDHTAMIDSLGRISGYAYELRETNKLRPDVFVALHNNGATNRNACWGYVHEGDAGETQNRELAGELVAAVCEASGLENGGVLGDSSPNRNDYRCKNSGKLSFYSLDENINSSPIRVLLEIGDNKVSFELLMDPAVQKKIGVAIQKIIEQRFGKAKP